MGCCFSTPSSHYPTQHPNLNSSSRAITSSQPPSQAALPRPSTHASSYSNRQHPQARDLTSHLNKPLRLHLWASKNRVWTNAELERERIDFFDTRTSGRPEVWQTIKAVLEILWSGGELGDRDGGLGTAQQILDAAEITLPYGDLTPGVYDSFGAYYPIPEHVLSDPTNLMIVSPQPLADKEQNAKRVEEIAGELDEHEILKIKREEKGKAVMKPRDLIKVRVKLSDRDAKPLQVVVGKEDNVRSVALKIMEESDCSSLL